MTGTRWLIGLVAVLSVLGVGAIAVAFVSAAEGSAASEVPSPDHGSAAAPPDDGAPGGASGDPADDAAEQTSASASQGPGALAVAAGPRIADLADPAWSFRVATATGIPDRALRAYAGADLFVRAEAGCDVGWNTLAAIGSVESDHGRLQGGTIGDDGIASPRVVGIALDGAGTEANPDTDRGELDGDPRWDRAVGPMQFIPESWRAWGSDGNGDGLADIDQIDDAALSAARYLCHAHGTLSGPDAWIDAIASYNSSTDYNHRVAETATAYAQLAEGIEP